MHCTGHGAAAKGIVIMSPSSIRYLPILRVYLVYTLIEREAHNRAGAAGASGALV